MQVGAAGEAAAFGDGGHRQTGILEQAADLAHPHLQNDIHDTGQRLLLIEAADVDRRHSQFISDLVQA
ncbi:hypothetical protein D3C87_2056630 [compost metagenome]